MGGARRCEIAILRVVNSFLIIHALHQFRDEDIEVRITLSVTMGWQVERHLVQARGEIRAMIEIEAPQEILVRFAPARVLGDDNARHRFKNLPGSRYGAQLELFGANCALGGRVSNTKQAVGPAIHDCSRQAHGLLVLAFSLDSKGIGGRLAQGRTTEEASYQYRNDAGCHQADPVQ